MLRIALIILSLWTSLFSEEAEEFPFLGISISTQSVDIKNVSDKQNTTIGIRYGKQTQDWRTLFSVEYKKNGLQVLSMGIDKILMDNIMGMPEFRPYAGASVGMMRYDDSSIADNKGMFFGASLGLLVYVTDNIDADISYKYYKVNDNDAIDNIQGGTFSLHYFY